MTLFCECFGLIIANTVSISIIVFISQSQKRYRIESSQSLLANL